MLVRALVGGLAGAVSGGLFTLSRAVAAAKTPKPQAGYKDAPSGGKRCDRCVYFEPPKGCKLVDGAISPAGSCDFFAPKPS